MAAGVNEVQDLTTFRHGCYPYVVIPDMELFDFLEVRNEDAWQDLIVRLELDKTAGKGDTDILVKGLVGVAGNFTNLHFFRSDRHFSTLFYCKHNSSTQIVQLAVSLWIA